MGDWLGYTNWQAPAIVSDEVNGEVSAYYIVSIEHPDPDIPEKVYEFGVRRRRDGEATTQQRAFVWYLSKWRYPVPREPIPDLVVADAGDDGWALIEQLCEVGRNSTVRASFFASASAQALDEELCARVVEHLL